MSFVNGVLIPNQVIILVGEERKTLALGIIVGISAILSLLAGPMSGYLSDTVFHGERFPLIFLGTVLWSISVVARSPMAIQTHSSALLWLLLVCYTLVTTAGKIVYAAAVAPYTAMIADLFPRGQYGVVSSVLGLCGIIGAIVGIAVFGYLYNSISVFVNCLLVSIFPCFALIVLFIVRERPRHEVQIPIVQPIPEGGDISDENRNENRDDDDGDDKQQQEVEHQQLIQQQQQGTAPKSILSWHIITSIIEPFSSRAFTLVFIGTSIANVALWGLQGFALYYIRDAIHPRYELFGAPLSFINSPERAQAAFALACFVTGIFSSIIAGVVLDSCIDKRKYVVIFGCIASSLFMIANTVSSSFSVFMLTAPIFGIGMGTIVSSTLSLASDTLPNMNNAAKDLAVWGVARNAPVIIASPLFGVIISLGNLLTDNHLINSSAPFGYKIMLFICAVLTFIAAIVFALVPSTHPPSSPTKLVFDGTTDE